MRFIPPLPAKIRFSKTFQIALALAAVLAAVIVYLNIERPGADSGAIIKSCGALHWTAWDLPIEVYVDETARDWEPAVRRGAAMWTEAAGRPVFDVRSGTPTVYESFRRAFYSGGPEPVRKAIIVAGATELVLDDDEDGHARIRYNVDTCRIGYVAARFPDGEPLDESLRTSAAAHELGHILGYRHDLDPRSVMADTALPGQKILAGDAAHARATFKL